MTTPSTPSRGQRGLSLIFALLALAAMSLAAVALVRSVDTSALIAGNLAFRQDSVAVSSKAAELAISWLDPLKASVTLNTDDSDAGYYATAITTLDPTNSSTLATRAVVNWGGDTGCASYTAAFVRCIDALPSITDQNGNRTAYVITRLCTDTKSPTDPTNACAKGLSSGLSEGGEKSVIDYNRQRNTTLTEAGPYYRIIVRTTGARNTVSYTETIVHF